MTKKITSSNKKIENFIENLINSSSFKTKVSYLRLKYTIPKDGFKYEDYSNKRSSWSPDIQHYYFDEDIEKISKEYGLDMPRTLIIKKYILFNFLEKIRWKNSGGIRIFNLKEIIIDTTNKKERADMSLTGLKSDAKDCPIAILISPYSTQRDVLNFVRELYETDIKPLLNLYKREGVKIGKIRGKNDRVRRRNNFIYEIRERPMKERIDLVEKEFGETLERSYINKITKDEKLKRK